MKNLLIVLVSASARMTYLTVYLLAFTLFKLCTVFTGLAVLKVLIGKVALLSWIIVFVKLTIATIILLVFAAVVLCLGSSYFAEFKRDLLSLAK